MLSVSGTCIAPILGRSSSSGSSGALPAPVLEGVRQERCSAGLVEEVDHADVMGGREGLGPSPGGNAGVLGPELEMGVTLVGGDTGERGLTGERAGGGVRDDASTRDE
jgi:hypothetical protein